ncbi:MAG TPA: HD domain-containing protein [Bacillota bacterium]|nr:HD domain-containing protein [Bacillota bacterium]HPP85442.1 HD domain-containing protein [Bacillota bacterium]
MKEINIKLYDFLNCISDAVDLVSPILSNHHQKVAYLSYRLAEQLNIPEDRKFSVFIAALLHDVGSLSIQERLEIIEREPDYINIHAFNGYRLFREFSFFENEAKIIKYHHLPWNYGEGKTFDGEEVPFECHIIHLADRVSARIDVNNVLFQLRDIRKYVQKNKDKLFEPNIVDALLALSQKEYIWLDLASQFPIKNLPKDIPTPMLNIDDIISLSSVIAQIVDFRSKFTARHTAGVAQTASKLAELAGMTPYECKMMLVAGYLHDLGKLVIDPNIIDKPNGLNEFEVSKIRSHTYYTYQLLNRVPQFDEIKKWAAYHHEKINGNGYPFHLKGDELPLGSRVMAVADVFTAITEDRPYRVGMRYENAVKLLMSMVDDGSLDGDIVKILIENYHDINKVRIEAQEKAVVQYNRFLTGKKEQSLHKQAI